MSTQNKPTVSGRVAEIFRLMHRHSFLSNFIQQQNPAAVRQTFEELGPTFIKLGQVLSTRPDLVSPSYVTELRKLQSQVAYDTYDDISAVFQADTGQSIDETFASFDPHPFASASIAQAYHAKLPDGTPVVVKVQHPDVDQLVHTDLTFFSRAIKMFHYMPTGDEVVDPQQVFDELSSSLLSELDFHAELLNGQRFYKLNNGQGIITIPRSYAGLSGQRVLVTEQMRGQSINHLLAKKETTKGLQQIKQTVAKALVRNFIKQVFADRFFHADPHPGNIFFYELPSSHQRETIHHHQLKAGSVSVNLSQETELPPYRIGYIDFGMMGTLSPTMADGIARIVVAITARDIHAIGEAILAVCQRTGDVDEPHFYHQLGIFLRPYLNAGLGEIDFSTMLYSIIHLCTANHLRINSEVTMLVRAFALLENTVAQLDPDMSMMDVARPFAKRYFQQKFSWRALLDDSLINGAQAGNSLSHLPNQVNTLLTSLNEGTARVNVHYSGEKGLLLRLERMVNRLIIAIILAAVIVGSSLLVQGSADHPNILKLGTVGFVFSILVIIGLVIATIIHRWRLKRH